MRLDDVDVSNIREWPTGRLLSTAARLVERRWDEALSAHNLTHAGLIVLHLLSHGGLSQSELATRAKVERQTMSSTVERLERYGFIERHMDETDRRRWVVSRTNAGDEVWLTVRHLEASLFPSLTSSAKLREALLHVITEAAG